MILNGDSLTQTSVLSLRVTEVLKLQLFSKIFVIITYKIYIISLEIQGNYSEIIVQFPSYISYSKLIALLLIVIVLITPA